MDRSKFIAIAGSIKPSVRKMAVESMGGAEIELHYPQVAAVLPMVIKHPVLMEYFFQATVDGKPAFESMTPETMIDIFAKIGTDAIAVVIASAMRNPSDGTSYAGDREVLNIIREWSPGDHIQALWLINEVHSFIDFFARLWSLGKDTEMGRRMVTAFLAAFPQNSSENEPNKSSESGTEPASEPSQNPAQPSPSSKSPSSSDSTGTTSSSDSEKPSAESAAAA